jgi:hypothetical protein
LYATIERRIQPKTEEVVMQLDKSKLALIVLGTIILAELILVGVLAGLHVPIPDPAWSLLYATLGALAGVAGAQAWNGKTQ